MIRQVMNRTPVTVEADAGVATVVRRLRQAGARAVLIVEGTSFAGIVTRDALTREIALGSDPTTPVGAFASRGVRTVGPDDSVERAVLIMREDDVRHVPVVRDARAIGLVSLDDLAAAEPPKV
jgi:signal-transduction protein with cAMP-binding, CBS, and nucleotidyltransferase domain